MCRLLLLLQVKKTSVYRRQGPLGFLPESENVSLSLSLSRYNKAPSLQDLAFSIFGPLFNLLAPEFYI